MFRKSKIWIVKNQKLLLVSVALILLLFYLSLPRQLFSDPYSIVVQDSRGQLLSAAIAGDEQWRFPEQKNIPEKFVKALVAFEDKRFFGHIGIDFISFGRAIKQNIQQRKIVSGGSTLSMQVMRLARKNKQRTLLEKMLEMWLAMRLELRYSKAEILTLYTSHAPFGGNVVGLDAACWRYFGREPNELSWAEAALLAVLPNNPSLIHLGKNRERLTLKRNRLLTKLHAIGLLDQLSLDLAKAESIPDNPVTLPRGAPHLLDRLAKQYPAKDKIKTTIDGALQQQVKQILNSHHQRLKGNQIFNAAALVMEVKTGKVVAYIGNVEAGANHEESVDIITSPRSTGSILKPFLYAAMLDEGKMLPRTLQPDIPVVINGFAPQNFSKEHDGAVLADRALIRSLNIPAVFELRDYRYEKFYELLKNVGLTTLHQPADHYGLSLILGGAEATLWDITGAYASMARTLNNFFEHPGKNKYRRTDFHAPYFVEVDSTKQVDDNNNGLEETSHISASAAYLTFAALQEVYRPGEQTGWRYFNNAKHIAWKTGTSHGFRDGWAVGLNAEYAVGVWVGNADGEGRPGLTGTETAAPILFDVFSLLPGNAWFSEPKTEMVEIPICAKSGYRISSFCESTDTVWVVKAGLQTAACPFHKKIHLSKDKRYQLNSGCEQLMNMVDANWFVLPPVQEYYYRIKISSYRPLPTFRNDCVDPRSILAMDIIYPKPNSKIVVPRELDGSIGNTVLEATHRTANATIYWHLDGEFKQVTRGLHKIAVHPAKGKHTLTIVDEKGDVIEQVFEVL
jgi:penicillin-binding protein 1C